MFNFHNWKGQKVVCAAHLCAVDQVMSGDIQKVHKMEAEQNLGFKSMIHETFS